MRYLILNVLILSISSGGRATCVNPSLNASVEALFNNNRLNATSNVGTPSLTLGSTAPPKPPSNFSVTYIRGYDELSVAACFFNSLDALETMALLDYEGFIDTTETYQIPGFTDTSIEVVPADSNLLQRRFAVWGLYLGLVELWSRDLFLTTTATLSWDDQIVGNITFQSSQANGNGTTSLARRSTPSPYSCQMPAGYTNSTGLSNVTAEEVRCTAQFSHIAIDAVNMNPFDVLFPVLDSLVGLAEYPSSSRLAHEPAHEFRRDWYRLLDGFNGRIFIYEHPRDQEPYLEYGDVIVALVQMVWFMVESLHFAPTDIDLIVGGVDVGGGTFLKRGMAPDQSARLV